LACRSGRPAAVKTPGPGRAPPFPVSCRLSRGSRVSGKHNTRGPTLEKPLACQSPGGTLAYIREAFPPGPESMGYDPGPATGPAILP
jgi:hypothetical protein